MITLSNGCKLLYLTASGAMGYNGRGWLHEQLFRLLGLLDVRLFIHRAKTITLPPREGNFRWYKPWDCVRPIWADGRIVGTVNAYGLTNPGLDSVVYRPVPQRQEHTPDCLHLFGQQRQSERIGNHGITARQAWLCGY